MKQILKSKSIIAVSVILFSFIQSAEAVFERREDRLRNSDQSNNNTYDPNDTGAELGSDTPIGDNISLFLGLGLVYGLYVFKKKQR